MSETKKFPIYLQSRDTFEQIKRISEDTHSIIVLCTGKNGYSKSLEKRIPTDRYERAKFEDKDEYLPSTEYIFKKFARQYAGHVKTILEKIIF